MICSVKDFWIFFPDLGIALGLKFCLVFFVGMRFSQGFWSLGGLSKNRYDIAQNNSIG